MKEDVGETKLAEQEEYFYEKFDFEANDREFFWELGYAEGFDIGRAEGLAEVRAEKELETKKELALRMYHRFNLPLEDISYYLDLNKTEQKTIRKILEID